MQRHLPFKKIKDLSIFCVVVGIMGINLVASAAGNGWDDSVLCKKVAASKEFLKVNPQVVPQPTPPPGNTVDEINNRVLKFYAENCEKLGTQNYSLEKFFSDTYQSCYGNCEVLTKSQWRDDKQIAGFCRSQCSAYNWQAAGTIQGIKTSSELCGTSAGQPARGKPSVR